MSCCCTNLQEKISLLQRAVTELFGFHCVFTVQLQFHGATFKRKSYFLRSNFRLSKVYPKIFMKSWIAYLPVMLWFSYGIVP